MNGMPIYAEKVERPLCDPADESTGTGSWHPSNKASLRLFRCVECLRDINDALVEAGAAKGPVKLRRKMKHMFVPLVSLAEAIIDLIHILQSDKDALGRMQPTDPKLLNQIEQRYSGFVPLSSQKLLRMIRNKMAAHVDKDMLPHEAQSLLAQAQPVEIGKWIHVSITVLSDLLKLNVYSWSTSNGQKDIFQLMQTEPLLATFRVEKGCVVELLGMDIVSKSPRMLVMDLIRETIDHSQWMFGANDLRINELIKDRPGQSWARSLSTLSALNWYEPEK